jgi:hypothetical protein
MSEAKCSRCGEFRDESSARDTSMASGRNSICKLCDGAKARAYYASNRDKVIARVQAYLGAHRGERSAFADNRRSALRRSFRRHR